MAERDRPTGERTGPEEGFLRRWSRRKTEARGAPDPRAADDVQPACSVPAAEPAEGAPAPAAPEDLPDVESLDAGSDFSAFMRPGVPEHLRAQALRKLWRSDPIFSKLDGLVEYGEDYTIQSWPQGMIRTAYQIGRGFVNELEKLEGGGPRRDPAEAAPEPTGDAEAAIASAQTMEPAETAEVPPASDLRSAAIGIEPQPASTSVPGKPRRRRLPRRG